MSAVRGDEVKWQPFAAFDPGKPKMKSICIGLLAGACALALQLPGAEAAKSNLEILYSFGAGMDGVWPHANLVDVKGTLYGTTDLGGTHSSGTIFAFDSKTCTPTN